MNANSATRSSPAYRRAPAEKRELLLAAARDLFAQQGFDQTSTAQIARRAGVSEGILFHHFGSKKNLFICLARDFAHAAAAATMPADPSHMTEETVVRNAFAFAESNPALYQLLMKGSAELSKQDIVAQSDIIVQAIRQNLQRGMIDGQVRRGNADIMAQLQFALVDAAYRAWRRAGDPARREDFISEAVTCMKAMLAPESDGQHSQTTHKRNDS
jgi:AcrR family transcriptional regulator